MEGRKMKQLDLFEIEDIPTNQQTHMFDAEEYQSIVLKSQVRKDEYTEYIQEAFDLQVGDVSKVCVPNKLRLESLGDWNIGVICGASGSGKSTILKHLAENRGGGKFQFPNSITPNVLFLTLAT